MQKLKETLLMFYIHSHYKISATPLKKIYEQNFVK